MPWRKDEATGWVWGSINPGRSVAPFKSIICVASFKWVRSSGSVPTATIFPLSIKTALAAGWSSSSVMMGPL